MRNKRVLLIRNVRPDYYGGGETYQLILAELLLKHGFKPVIVSSSKKLLTEAKRRDYEVVDAPYNTKQIWSGWRNVLFLEYYLWQRKLTKWYKNIYKEYKPSVVNIQSRDDWIAATRAAKGTDIRVLWTDHADMRSWALININTWYKNWIGKWILRCARDAFRIIMISDYERAWLDKNVASLKLKNIVTIKNGVLDKANEYNGIRSKKGSICYIGRIVDYKGLYELIDSFEEIQKERTETILNIYGDGEEYSKIKQKVKNNEYIKMYGRTDAPLQILAENDIFVLPSYREGLSLSLLDAAMMGKKIIASNVGGNPEIVQNRKTGLLVKAKDSGDLKNALLWMLDNEDEARKMAKAARALYEHDYNSESIFVKEMLPVYKKDSNVKKC